MHNFPLSGLPFEVARLLALLAGPVAGCVDGLAESDKSRIALYPDAVIGIDEAGREPTNGPPQNRSK